MSIIYDEKENLFFLNTKNSTYVMGVLCKKYLLHLHYGKRIRSYKDFANNLPVLNDTTWCGMDVKDSTQWFSTEILPMEYPTYGSADLRTPAFHAEYENGSALTCLEYDGYVIYGGKKPLLGLPSTYVESESEAITLEITLIDRVVNTKVILNYVVFEEYDAIAKSVRIVNSGLGNINVKSALSSTTYIFDKNYDFVHLQGAWGRERHVQKNPLINGIMEIDSKRVASGHIHSPFLSLARPWATENQGEVYGYCFVYSGNFIAQVETNQQDVARVNIGINPFGFNWLLSPGEEFQTPEVVMTFSDEGFGKMSRVFHRLFRERLCRGKYRDCERPVLLNCWEALYFDFNEDDVLKIAHKAKTVGVELIVVDDGWFGNRNSGDTSLGDWFANSKKIPSGIDGLARRIESMGLRFGLWFEPEMMNEDSDLFKAHPDWYIGWDNRSRTHGRGLGQIVLDLSRPEICDYIVDVISTHLRSAPISYVKWDMNRNITEIGSASLPKERMQELPHRYILGLYSILDRLVTDFPDVLFEGCSGGGGRFDAGMLHYYPQWWTSDDTDAIERLYIQHGTSFVMPASTMSAHVSAVPNHQVHRSTPLETRGHVAMVGQFGYEMDLNKLSNKEIQTVKDQIMKYKSIRQTVHFGNMYRLRSPFDGRNAAWEYVAQDGSQVVLMYCTISGRVLPPMTQVRLEGLDANAQYCDRKTGKIYDGDFLMNVGLYMADRKDYETRLIVLNKC